MNIGDLVIIEASVNAKCVGKLAIIIGNNQQPNTSTIQIVETGEQDIYSHDRLRKL